jgi:hypothetical protein
MLDTMLDRVVFPFILVSREANRSCASLLFAFQRQAGLGPQYRAPRSSAAARGASG